MGNCCVENHDSSYPKKDIVVDMDKSAEVLKRYDIKRSVTENFAPQMYIKSALKLTQKSCEKTLKWIKEESKKHLSSKKISALPNGTKRKKSGTDFMRIWSKKISTKEEVEDVVDKEEYKDCERKVVSEVHAEKIYQILSNNFLFSDMSDELFKLIMSTFFQLEIEDGKFIYEKGFEGDFLFIIAKGKVNIVGFDKKTIIKQYKQWDSFGHMSLFCGIKKRKTENSAICEGDVILYVLNGESFQNIQKEMMKINFDEKFNFVNEIPILKNLESVFKFNITESIQIREYDQEEKINDIDPCLILVKKGEVKIEIAGEAPKILKENETFGEELILVSDSPRFSLTAMEESVCYHIYAEGLRDALGDSYRDTILFSYFNNCILNHPYLKKIFSEKNIMTLFNSFKLKTYLPSSNLYTEEEKNKIKIVLVIIGKFEGNEAKYENGEFIGSKLSQEDKEKDHGLVSVAHSLVLEGDLSRIAFIMNLNSNKNTIKDLKRMNMLKKYPIFRFLSESLLKATAESVRKEKFKDGDVIVKEGTIGSSLYLIEKGIVTITKEGQYIRDLEEGNLFGEMALIADNDSGDKRTASVSAKGDVTCYVLSKRDFDFIMNSNKLFKKYIVNKIAIQDTSVKISDLFYCSRLGKGKFADVYLVRNNKNYYSMKSISIRQTTKDKMVKYVMSEKNTLLLIDHPFIIKLVKTLKSKNFVYFLLEYVNGQSLQDYLTTRCMLKKADEVRFYAASLLIILEYLSKKMIAHRDIKPNNIMIDSNGFLKLIDFGTAKIITDYTSTVIGTPQYTAPEILKGKGYSLSCDFWSVGIVAYEIYYGKCPYGNCCGGDVMAVYRNILYDNIAYSNTKASQNVDDFIDALLKKKPNKRQCNVNALRRMPLFQEKKKPKSDHEVDYFEKLIEYQIEPPYKPKVKELKMGGETTFLSYEKHLFPRESAIMSSMLEDSPGFRPGDRKRSKDMREKEKEKDKEKDKEKEKEEKEKEEKLLEEGSKWVADF